MIALFCHLLAVKQLYSCSDICVRVGGIKPRPFTVGVEQGCALSPLLFIVYLNRIENHSRVDRDVSVGSCRSPFDLCGQFGTACTIWTGSPTCFCAGFQLRVTKRKENALWHIQGINLSRNLRQCILQGLGNALHLVASFKYHLVVFKSGEIRTRRLQMHELAKTTQFGMNFIAL